jgi:hypothetical protein
MRGAGAEQHAIGHDDGSTATGLEQAQEEGEEEQFGLLGLHYLLQVLSTVLVVERAGEGRIGQDEGVFLVLPGVLLGERVTVDDVGIFHAVQE